MLPIEKVSELNQKAQTLEAQQILSEALSLIPNIAISFSGAEDVVLIAMAIRIRKDIPVFTLDTGRLHSATYRFIERVRKHFKFNLEVLYPEATRVSELVSRKGLFSFYEDGHEECCRIRKVEPLRQKLATLDGWVTGQRRDQSPTRAQVPIYQIDNTFSSTEQSLIKVNPLANMSLQQVWEYIRMFDVPYNELHDQGFISIGCEPCSRATGPGQHEREGRWWWEEGTIKECGLHRDSMIATSSIKD